MSKTYFVEPYGKYTCYKGLIGAVQANSASDALKKVLKDLNIEFNTVTRITAKFIGEYLDKGWTNMEIINLTDFTVSLKGDMSLNSIISYHID